MSVRCGILRLAGGAHGHARMFLKMLELPKVQRDLLRLALRVRASGADEGCAQRKRWNFRTKSSPSTLDIPTCFASRVRGSGFSSSNALGCSRTTGWRRPFGPGRLTNATPAHATRPLKITEVGTQSFSPLFWAIQSGSLNSAKAMLQELFLGIFGEREWRSWEPCRAM